MPKIFLTAILAAIFLPSAPAIAAPNVAINYSAPEAYGKISIMYTGSWQISHHARYLLAGRVTVAFPASGDLEAMQIETLPIDQLIDTDPETRQPIQFVWADEPPWSFKADASNDGASAPLLSSSEVEMLVECGVEDLARLIGRTQATIDGMTMDMTLRLMVVGPDQMYGVFHTSSTMNGTPVKS